jgi:hypothetical protein
VLDTIFLVCASLSVLGSASIIFGTLYFRQMSRTVYSFRLVTFLSIADLCGALCCIGKASESCSITDFSLPAGVVGNDYLSNSSFCVFQASGLQYFYLCSFLWTTCFAHSLYLSVTRKRKLLLVS